MISNHCGCLSIFRSGRSKIIFKDDEESPLKTSKILADSGFSNQDTLSYLEEKNIDGYIADHGFRARDPRFSDAEQHRVKPP